jgi:putative ABC transport system ATP-binding protein
MSITFQSVTFSYPSSLSKQIIDIDSWSVADSEKVFLHGPSGCGKSTLLNLISGLLKPQSGDVKLLGKSLNLLSRSQKDAFRANNVGYVFQQFNLIPFLDVIENISLASHFATKKSKQLLIKQSHELLNTLDIKEALWYKPVNQLSIGQQQRIAIARALINKPKILIADEPTSALDQANRSRFMSLLIALCAQHRMTLIFVSHDMSLSQHFDRVQALPAINAALQTN